MAIKSKNILVTGSAGYLGSPFCYDLLKMGYRVIGIDNYLNSNERNTKELAKHFKERFTFYKIDLAENISNIDKIFEMHKPSFVAHFAALKSVDESEKIPEKYWRNNVQSTKHLLNSMINFNCNKIIYSSSAAVYGNQDKQPIYENAQLNPLSIYAKTKVECEQLIKEANINSGIDGISLRYFNPIGSHSSKLFKEDLKEDFGSIMNEIIKAALNEEKVLKIFGNNFKTKDGTTERDFIHIDDLLNAHIKSLTFLQNFKGYDVFNVGTGRAISILDLLLKFIKYNDVKLKYEFSKKKNKDIQTSYSNVEKINSTFNWKSIKTIKDMVRDSWQPYSNQ